MTHKLLRFTPVAIALGITWLAGTTPVLAEDTVSPITKTTDATLTIVGGQLEFGAIPDKFDFDKADLKTIFENGYTDEATTQAINVNDYRGTNAGWQLNAKFDFFNAPALLTDTELHLKVDAITPDSTVPLGNQDVSLTPSGEDTHVWATDNTKTGAFANQAQITPTLKIPRGVRANIDELKGKITWTLINKAPDAAASSSNKPN